MYIYIYIYTKLEYTGGIPPNSKILMTTGGVTPPRPTAKKYKTMTTTTSLGLAPSELWWRVACI